MTYDPMEFMDQTDLNDYQVRQHLYAQRRLADLDQIDTKAKVAKMLAEVVPGARVCGMAVTTGAVEGEKAKRGVCGQPGIRMLGLTGDWTCDEHDPLRRPAPPVCCVWAKKDDRGRTIIELCEDTDGLWECTAGIEGHGWGHRHSRLGGA